VPPVPLLELNAAGLDRLNAAEASLKEARLQIASSRQEIESLLNDFHSAQLMQTVKSRLVRTQSLEELLPAHPRPQVKLTRSLRVRSRAKGSAARARAGAMVRVHPSRRACGVGG
jgi:hypothetical protein